MKKGVYDGLINKILISISFLLPFYLVGFRVGAYIFSATTFLFIALGAVFSARGVFRSSSLSVLYILVAWSFLVTFPRYSFSSYGMSLLALGAMTLPLCAPIPASVDRQSVLQALIYGAVASFVFAAYDLGVNFGLPPLTNVLNVALWGTSVPQESSYFGVYRVKAAFSEPAHYAHYLTFVYALVDIASRRGYSVKNEALLKSFLLFFLFFTMSLSGLILFLSYQGSVLVWEWRERVLATISSVWFWLSLPLVFVLLVVVWQKAGDQIIGYVFFLFDRIDEAYTAIQLGLVSGSEASRARSATIVFEYWASQDILHLLVGEGYANYEEWLIQTFAGRGEPGGPGSSFGRGNVQNVFSAVGISVGLIGLIVYCIFLWSMFGSKRYLFSCPFIICFLVYHCAVGILIGYRFWWPILIGMVLFRREGNY